MLSCSLLFSFVKSDSPDMNCHVPRPIIIGYSAETGSYRVSGPTMGEFLGTFSFSVGNEEGGDRIHGVVPPVLGGFFCAAAQRHEG